MTARRTRVGLGTREAIGNLSKRRPFNSSDPRKKELERLNRSAPVNPRRAEMDATTEFFVRVQRQRNSPRTAGRDPGDVSVRIGCCGWAEGRAQYFDHFPAVELQSTFYDLPTPALAQKWRAAAPQKFQFCIKAWQLITHTPASPTYRRLKSPIAATEHDLLGSFRPTEQVWLAWLRTEQIARALDAQVILFQCPASFGPTAENIRNFRDFFQHVEAGPSRLAWEPRGEWPPALIRELCAECNLVHCVDPMKSTSVHGSMTYWRMHGRNSYFYTYSDEELAWLRVQAQERLALGQAPMYLFFNNTAMKSDALRLQAALVGTPIAHPSY